ncbi:retrotransposon protein, putative, ty1-copia subclass [Tanacetum coccineum]
MACLKGEIVWGCEALVKRDTPDKLQQRYVKCIFIGYPKETMGYYFYFPPENKIVVARYVEFFEKSLITQEVSGRAIDLKEIQYEDTSSSKITSEIPMVVEGFELPQEKEIPIRRSERSRRVPNRLCLDVEADAHSLRDLNEPTSYKAAMVDYEETFSPMADIRAIMILMSITTFYDYEIWQMNVKTAFLNGYLDEDIYRVDCHNDAGFETDRDDIKSQTRYVFVLNGGAMDWKSSKQSTTAMSATEAEYIAASEAAMKAIWIRKFISGLGIVPTINEPIKMFCDNCAALLIANELGVQKGARHYHRRYHYVRGTK